MNFYTKIPIWENKRRITKLIEFRKLISQYFGNSHTDWRVDGRIEEEAAQEARVEINLKMDEAYKIILRSGINPSLKWTPPAVIGGYIQNVDLIHNIFILEQYEIPPQTVFDYLDRSIGIYKHDQSLAWVRTFNPLFYIEILFDWVARLPFTFIGKLGFDQNKVEFSFFGRIVKGALYLIIVTSSLLTILSYLDYLEPFKQFLKVSLGSN